VYNSGKTEALFHPNEGSIYPKQRLYFDKTEPLFHESNNSLYIRCQNKMNLLMKRSFLYVIFSLFLLLLPIGQTTANSNDSIRLSLLTCAPGEVIYTLFGHTAIRYENPSQGIDVVFNYGLFSFDIPNFALRFSLGETDYRLGVIDYPHFAGEYAYSDAAYGNT